MGFFFSHVTRMDNKVRFSRQSILLELSIRKAITREKKQKFRKS
jgi:hypothetical protein